MFRLIKVFLFSGLIFLGFAASQTGAVSNVDSKINLYFFYGNGCPHCAKEEKFLNQLQKEYLNLDIKRFEVWYNRDNAKLLSDLGEQLDLNVSSVPLLIIGDRIVSGYLNDETTGEKIRSLVNDYALNGGNDIVAPILGSNNQSRDNGQCTIDCDESTCDCAEAGITKKAESSEVVNVPFLGEVKVKDISLPVLTILIGALDGFNPCAMWVLLFLVSLLLGMKDRRKMWILGVSFIASSALVYFLFLSAWLNLFLFLGFIFWIRIAIAFFAIASGAYHLRQYFKNRKGTCEVTASPKRQLFFSKLRAVIAQDNFLLALGGIIILAAAVNLVELLCSAGLPAIYTQILSLSSLPKWQYYAYLVLYIFIFMLDDLIVFILAMLALKMKAINSKYSRWANLIGGIVILIIGLLLLFRPAWLMFG